MIDADDLLISALRKLSPKPADTAPQAEKKAYSESMSAVIALALAEALHNRNLRETLPASSMTQEALGGPKGKAAMKAWEKKRGAERRMAGGLGAKKVDVTWATEEGGLLLALSIKSVNFRDQKTGNFQKNLTNRRGDMLYESTTLHRRFPYAVLGGFIFLDKGAGSDQTTKRKSTFVNAHTRFRMFTGRDDPAGRPEQYERLYVVLVDANPDAPKYQVSAVGSPDQSITLEAALAELLDLIAERNPDFYEVVEGRLEAAQ